MKITKNTYLASFAAVVFVLAIVKLIFPGIDNHQMVEMTEKTDSIEVNEPKEPEQEAVKQPEKKRPVVEQEEVKTVPHQASKFIDEKGNPIKHRILSVASYSQSFPDSQQVQILAANKWGVKPVANRSDAESRKKELVYMGASPYYHVDPMHRSIPYLVPRAAALLSDMGRAFMDSLQLKGVPLHQFIVTSVLRTKEDVSRLRNYNGNATENSCHLYGTTFDICYNRYHTVQPPSEKRRAVRNDTLKWILTEMLRDMREQKRCYIKYEVKQGCYHITVR